jgi:carbonic anhydrase/acetyltransferase-like protein (isoleucine patch superfamily)
MPIYALRDLEPTIDATAYVHPDAVIIGRVEIGPGSSVWPCAVLRGDDGTIRIGARTSVQDGSVLHCTRELDTLVGDEAVIGHMVHLEGCVVEDRALVGNGSIVLHRAVIRTGALVGSNAVVPADMEVPSGAMALGVPAKLREGAVKPEMILEPMQSYVARAERYRNDLRRVD